jgi:hypothetical protein
MKKFFFTFFLTLLSFLSVLGQSPDSMIEVRLSLAQQSDGNNIKGLTLCIYVINHTNEDVYIPAFYAKEINYYKKTDSGWKELDIYTHQFYNGHKNEKGHIEEYPPFIGQKNEIAKYYNNNERATFNDQQRIFSSYLTGIGQKRPHFFTLQDPVFLKAKQEIKYFWIQTLDYWLAEPADYRISFNLEVRYPFSGVANWIGPGFKFPDHIFGYKMLSDKNIFSNTIYYSTLPMTLKK